LVDIRNGMGHARSYYHLYIWSHLHGNTKSSLFIRSLLSVRAAHTKCDFLPYENLFWCGDVQENNSVRQINVAYDCTRSNSRTVLRSILSVLLVLKLLDIKVSTSFQYCIVRMRTNTYIYTKGTKTDLWKHILDKLF